MPRPHVFPSVAANVIIPDRFLDLSGINALKRDLLAQHHDSETHRTTNIPLWRRVSGGYSVPRSYANDKFADIVSSALDRTAKLKLSAKLYAGKSIEPRDAAQATFMQQVIDMIMANGADHTDIQIEAGTGTGKTVAILKALLETKICNAIIIVNKNTLKNGWLGNVDLKKGFKFFFGEEWTERNVGIVQQDRCDLDKPIVIAMAPSLVSRVYPKQLYEGRGLLVVDEVHKMATPTLHDIFNQFPACIRIGMTATEKTGSMGKVVRANLGRPRIVSKQKPMQPTVVRIPYRRQVNWTNDEGKPSGDNKHFLKMQLTRFRDRNELLAQIIYQRGYQKDRHCLCLSDRINQLTGMRTRLIQLGVPEEQIGLYVGEYETGMWKPVAQVVDLETGKVVKRIGRSQPYKTKALAIKAANEWFQREDVKEFIKKSNVTVYAEARKEKRKPSEDEYQHIEENCQIMLATYGMFDTGQDVARLDWGIELSPRGDVRQPVGRVLRTKQGKKTPVWYTIDDHLVQTVTFELLGKQISQHYNYKTPKRLAKQRLASYIAQNAKLKRVDNPYDALTT